MADALPEPAYDEAPRVGRPRDPRVDEAVRAATLELLVEEGYQATSIQAIARRAEVSAPSIYRRWSSKAELIEEAVFPDPYVEPTALTGDLEHDLTTYCRSIIGHLGDPAVRAAIPGLLTEYQTDPHLWHRLAQRSVTPMRQAFARFLAETDHEPVGSVDALFDVMMGSLFVRAINSGAAGADAFAGEVARIVAQSLRPVRRRRRLR
ncbi:MAG TPA: TetR/AcrR family transcriptional regulator [Mycobacteriales bacterium]|nr:TetR/AcrR family transcriptional regulator [Mycobacteriales bacterium]